MKLARRTISVEKQVNKLFTSQNYSGQRDTKSLFYTHPSLIHALVAGLGIYAAWSTVATLLNAGIASVYRQPHFDEKIVCFIVLSESFDSLAMCENVNLRNSTSALEHPKCW